ncbi:hypothetical protein [Marinimicrobium locisalis]|uniref:hypothetical protein n=1 Tax=Marinimicrobium locisalis TaxID=546022 RepID=UPI003221D9ED
MRTLLFTFALLAASAQAEDGWEDWESGGEWEPEADAAVPLYGFVELAAGQRLSHSPYHDGSTLGEARLRLETEHSVKSLNLSAKGDLWYDTVLEKWKTDTRELTVQKTLSKMDIKLGRQVVTWGTGDYLFLNDLFAKDWQSFFIGRDDEYLKGASDSLRLTGYFELLNLDLVWTPSFTPDRYPTGERLSLFEPGRGHVIGEDNPIATRTPEDDEWALRLYRNLGSTEFALYGYDGYHKSPNASNAQGRATFTELTVLGASVRRPIGEGLVNAEIAHHDSTEDEQGHNPRISNSQWRVLVGYERELATRLTAGFQGYLEQTQDYEALLAHSPAPEREAEENRTLLTTRLTWRDARDRLTLSLFAFYSPSDEDGYLRPKVDYRFNDNLSLTAGANLFRGSEPHSFFGQFEDNSNAYARLRYAF